MKIRAGWGRFRAGGGTLGQRGAPPLLFHFMDNTTVLYCTWTIEAWLKHIGLDHLALYCTVL